jgi:hypothetical protein
VEKANLDPGEATLICGTVPARAGTYFSRLQVTPGVGHRGGEPRLGGSPAWGSVCFCSAY